MADEGNLMSQEQEQEPTLSAPWKMVDEALTLKNTNWGLNLMIFWMIQSNELNASEVVKVIKKKINDESRDVQIRALLLLESFGHNCDAFYTEVVSQNLHEDLVRLVENPQNDYGNRRKAFRLLMAWAESREVPRGGVFNHVYWGLAYRVSSDISGRKSVHVRHTLESLTPEEDHFDLLDRYQPMSDQEKIDLLLLEGRRPAKLVEEQKKYLVLARKSLQSLFSILHSEGDPKPLKECSTLRWLDRCKKSLHVIMEILETSTNDELLVWLEAIRLSDQLELVLGKYQELAAAEMNAAQQPEKAGPAKHDANAVQNLNELVF
ncbi:TOM1-like protein 2 [Lotus japonicus]|uniref:TOM1-like protein 2 n=1 Tax=Lotus japonicus TaxID=34305 RepID=UPI00258C31FF|nr:TOM1-like protein 2 [Lotus japonicus]